MPFCCTIGEIARKRHIHVRRPDGRLK